MSPVLEQLAEEFGSSAGVVGLVVAAYGAPGVVVALIAGPFSDRIGRKPFLVGGPVVMGLATVAAAAAPSFPLIIAARVVAGAGAAVIFPNINATVADTFPYRERGAAISTVMGMNTMASILGVPLAGIVAEATTWRVSVALVGIIAILAAVVLFLGLPGARGANEAAPMRSLYASIFRNRSAMAAIVSSFLGALFWFTWVTYLVVFFQRTFGLAQGVASTLALTMGVGVLLGSQIGGRLGDRTGHRRIVAGSILTSGALLFLQTNLSLPLVVTAALNLALSTVIGARFATNNTLMTEQVPEARGTMLAMSSAVASLAITVGSAIGGRLIDGPGFAYVGLFCLCVAATSAVIVTTLVREEPIDLEAEPLR